jgi:hypothetical protein
MLVTLSALASQQTNGTERTMDDMVKFLNYCATHPNATIRYKESDMILWVHSDASYLSESKARSRAGGLFYMGSGDIGNDTLNGAILASMSIMKPVLSSVSEAEIGALFDTARKPPYYALHLQKWDGLSQLHQLKLTTLQLAALPTITSSYSNHAPWICVSTGCVIAANRDTFTFSGNQEPLTSPTTSLSIMQHDII